MTAKRLQELKKMTIAKQTYGIWNHARYKGLDRATLTPCKQEANKVGCTTSKRLLGFRVKATISADVTNVKISLHELL